MIFDDLILNLSKEAVRDKVAGEYNLLKKMPEVIGSTKGDSKEFLGAVTNFVKMLDVGSNLKAIYMDGNTMCLTFDTEGYDVTKVMKIGSSSSTINALRIIEACTEHKKLMIDAKYKTLLCHEFCQTFMHIAARYGITAGMAKEDIRDVLEKELCGKTIFSEIMDKARKYESMVPFANVFSLDTDVHYIDMVLDALERDNYTYDGDASDELIRQMPEQFKEYMIQNVNDIMWIARDDLKAAIRFGAVQSGRVKSEVYKCNKCGMPFYGCQLQYYKGCRITVEEDVLENGDKMFPKFRLKDNSKGELTEPKTVCLKCASK